MKHRVITLRAVQVSAFALAVATLGGCDSLNDYFAPDHVDYKAIHSAPPLAVPSDLSAVPLQPKYSAPVSDSGLGNQPQLDKTSAGNSTEGVPSTQDPYGMHVDIDGNYRWLVLDGRSPEQVWSMLHDFWVENGFALKTDSTDTGVMITDWAENRANIPDDWFRRTIGRVLDFAYSSGTRDRFRTLVTRTPDGNTVISISHMGMVEETVGPQGGDSSRWVEAPRNPTLEALFLGKLMQKFGLTDTQSKELLSHPVDATANASLINNNGAPALLLAEPFDRVWPRIGVALDRTNYVIDSGDRTKGVYQVRYVNSADELKQDGLFGKLFGKGPAKQGRAFQIAVREAGDGTQVLVFDANGQPDTSSDAQKLITQLHAQLN